MTDPMPGHARTVPNTGSPDRRSSHYPRPVWFALLREWLIIMGPITTIGYALVIWATITQRSSSTSELLVVLAVSPAVLLMATWCIWAIRDSVREQRVVAERFNPARQAEAAEQRARNALAQAREQGDRRKEGVALGSLGFSLLRLGRIPEAEATLTQALAMDRADDDHLREASTLASLSGCARARGDLDVAEARLRECLAATLTLTPEDMRIREDEVSTLFPGVNKANAFLERVNSDLEASVLNEIADSYGALGYFLVDERGNGVEGRRMFAEAEARYREETRYYERAAQSLGFLARLRRNTVEQSLRRQALRRAKEMRALQRRYADDPV
jgi:tetratricopeptide (TPR) repeat protein